MGLRLWAIDQFGQVIDVFVLTRRDANAARRFFQAAIGDQGDAGRGRHRPGGDLPGGAGGAAADGLASREQYANNRVEADHGRLKARLRPMRGLKQDRTARVMVAGHAFVQNLRRGHYELAVEEPAIRRLTVAFDELALVI